MAAAEGPILYAGSVQQKLPIFRPNEINIAIQ
jgi:hypothetical protein